MAKVVCILYDDPVDGYPKCYPRDDLPKIDRYPDGQTLPTPKSIILSQAPFGSVSGELGLRKYLEFQGHKLVVTSDKDGANSILDRELPDAEIVISQPFWPAYMTTGGRPRLNSNWWSFRESAPITPIFRRPWTRVSQSRRSPSAIRSAFPSMWS